MWSPLHSTASCHGKYTVLSIESTIHRFNDIVFLTDLTMFTSQILDIVYLTILFT